ncbi:MAG: YceD family protein [Gammaproteobacteria bacterium]|jgi:uncharacterized protein
MIDHLPDRLDLCAMAEAGHSLRGRIRLDCMERVMPLVQSSEGEFEVLLEFGKDRDGTRYLSGSIRGTLILQCQRCLEPMEFPLHVKFRLGLVDAQEKARYLNARYEPLLVTQEPACIAEVVEDEILLALPIAPLHGDRSRCQGLVAEYQSAVGAPRDNPFAVLAQLKHKQ